MDSKFRKVFYLYASTQFLSTIIFSIGAFMVARMMKPEILGAFNGLGIFIGYLPILTIGILNGLGRELPYEIGRGNIDLVHDYVKVSWTVSLLISCLVLAGVSFFLIKSIIAKDTLPIFAYACYGITGFFQIINKIYFPFIYRTSNDFKRLSWISLVLAISSLLLVYFVYAYSFKGLAIRLVGLSLLEFSLLWKYNPQPLIGKFKWPRFTTLFKTGFPIFIVGQISPVWITAQNNLIFSWGGAKSYGLYSVVTMTTTFLSLIPASLGHMIYPQMSIAYGEGASKRDIVNLAVKSTTTALYLSLTFGVLAWILMPYVLKVALPNYRSATFAAQLAILTPLMLNIGLINNYFNVVKKQLPYFFSIAIGIIANAIFIFIAYRIYGFRLEIFPLGTFIGIIFQYSFNFLYIYRDVRR